MSDSNRRRGFGFLVVAAAVLSGPPLRADVVTDWDVRSCQIVVASRVGPPAANRVLAIVHTAVYEAVNAVTRRFAPGPLGLEAPPGAAVGAAIAAANRATLAALLPTQREAIEAAYRDALAREPEGPGRAAGIAVGEKAAAGVLALRADDGAAAKESYRPATAPGVYVPTTIPAVPQWPLRKPWLMASPSQFRPGPPPALASAVWARDFAEIKDIGSSASVHRTAEQTEIARFWEATVPELYHGLVRSVAKEPGREVTQNARLFMAVAQASDDAAIAVFDAKYHYGFWRPITAIRNGDLDGNDATERDSSWTPLIDTPMHPEYPCAHCIVSAAVGTVLLAEVGDAPMPTLTTSSPTAQGAVRSWTSVEDVLQEVANARIYDGVHFRNSTEVGTAMGRKIGALAAAKLLRPPK